METEIPYLTVVLFNKLGSVFFHRYKIEPYPATHPRVVIWNDTAFVLWVIESNSEFVYRAADTYVIPEEG